MSVQRLKRVADVGFISTTRAQSLIIFAEAFPYWLLRIDRQYVTFERIFYVVSPPYQTSTRLVTFSHFKPVDDKNRFIQVQMHFKNMKVSSSIYLISGSVLFLEKNHATLLDHQYLGMTTEHKIYRQILSNTIQM